VFLLQAFSEPVEHAGYINVNFQQDANLFYWVIESQGNPLTDPLVLWVSGGPGCSGGLALLYENGPWTVPNTDSPPIANPYSWNKIATVIWIDQPAYTGYSYSRTPYVTDEEGVAEEMRVFFIKFFAMYPQYSTLPFYISGESYGGRYVPTMAYMILSENANPSSPLWTPVNLKGISIGNGVVDPIYQYPVQGLFAYKNNLINESSYAQISPLENQCFNAIQNEQWSKADDSCGSIIIEILKYAGDINPMNYKFRCPIAQCFVYDSVTNFFNDPSTKIRLNVPQTVFWQACNFDVVFTSADMWQSFSWKIASSLSKNISVVIYYGELDCVAPWNGGLLWSENMQWNGREGFNKQNYQPWIVGGAIAGTYKSYMNFTFVRVSNGGHMTPHDQPRNSLELFRWFLSNP